MTAPQLAIRWTIGDVAPRGFEALRLAVHGARRVFGPAADYVICVNTVPLGRARDLAGELPKDVRWQVVESDALPPALRRRVDAGMAEGVAWKLAPPRLFPAAHEIAFDNDCILFAMPEAIRAWLSAENGAGCLVAEDVRAAFGSFAGLCGTMPRNTGIRGLPPGFDLEAALEAVFAAVDPATLRSELDEQGMQVAAVSRDRPPFVVSLEDVSICSPFPPHRPELGRCGGHFVGLNVPTLPWHAWGRPAAQSLEEHWVRHRPALYEAVGLAPPESLFPDRLA